MHCRAWIRSPFISIHAPRVGGDPPPAAPPHSCAGFQSTPPVWGATPRRTPAPCIPCHFNPRPPCGGRLRRGPGRLQRKKISIHAPRVGGDHSRCNGNYIKVKFQSTPPVWGATSGALQWNKWRTYFNPRPPCGGRRSTASGAHEVVIISIHAPRVGGDILIFTLTVCAISFQSTPPVWGATPGGWRQRWYGQCISIHAPRVGGDAVLGTAVGIGTDFNPRPPCGGRPSARPE